MDSERHLRSEFRHALETVTPPAPWLRAAVREELRNHRQESWRPSNGSFVTGLLILLLIAGLVVGLQAWRNADVNPHPLPVGQGPTIEQYQALVSQDVLRLDDTSQIDCTAYVYPNCLPAVAIANSAAQRWLDDLNRSQPPPRFVAVDALLRRHLALLIADNTAYVAAHTAKDMNGRVTISVAANAEQATLDSAVVDIDNSTQETIAGYSASVRSSRANLLACAFCQLLVSKNSVSCPINQTPGCADEIAAVRLQLEAFQGDLARYYAPDSLAAKDRRLQTDLLAASNALDAMTSALATGDQTALQTAHGAVRQALGWVDSDASDIAGSN